MRSMKDIDLQSADNDPLRAQIFPIDTENISNAQSSSLDSGPEGTPPTSNFTFLSGERSILYHSNRSSNTSLQCIIVINQQSIILGQMCVTNFRIIIEPLEASWCYENKYRMEYFEIPLMMIQRLERPSDKNYCMLDISTKDGRNIRIGVTHQAQHEFNLFTVLYSYTFPQTLVSRFAFLHRDSGPEDGWKIYNFVNDFARIGINPAKSESKWAFLDNSNWEYCETYPQTVVVPKELSSNDIKASANFRSKNRFPALAWANSRNGATLWRCSQPRTGIRTSISRCLEDEVFLRIISKSSGREGLHIFDARPYMNAHAQRAIGGGVENTSYYEATELHFLGIDNIHIIRESWHGALNSNSVNPFKYLSAFEKSGWLEHISLLLQGSTAITESLQNGTSALIHCSDGWDRTSQLCSIVQILQDPHYRTIRGFAQVIEKDWVSFGHQFDIRLGHANPNSNDEKRSPIFIQFLDCIYQLGCQFPTHFEFNNKFLHDLAEFAHSCRFGTFMCNNMKERVNVNLDSRSTSVWTYVFAHLDMYTNPYYQPGQEETIIPCCSPRRLQIWHELLSQWQPDYYYPVGLLLGPSDHKEALMKSTYEGMQMYKELIQQRDKEIQELKGQLAQIQGKEVEHLPDIE